MAIVQKSRVIHKCKVCKHEIPIGSIYFNKPYNKYGCTWKKFESHILCALRIEGYKNAPKINHFCRARLMEMAIQMNVDILFPEIQEIEIMKNTVSPTLNTDFVSEANRMALKAYVHYEDPIPKKIPKVLLVCHRGIKCNQEYNPADGKCCHICTDENKEECTYQCGLDINECKRSFIRIE